MNKKRRIISVIMLIAGLCCLLSVGKKENSYDTYTKKTWIVDDSYEGSSPFTFVITKIENGEIEGKVSTGDLRCLNNYVSGVQWFSGKIKNGRAMCLLENAYGTSGTLELTFLTETKMKGTLKRLSPYSVKRENYEEEGTYFFRPYNLKDIFELEYEIFEEDASFYNGEGLDFWGEVNVVAGVVNGLEPYPVAYLTNKQGDILLDFDVDFIDDSNIKVKDIFIGYFDRDELKDIRIITQSLDGYMFRRTFYQNEDGLFSCAQWELDRMLKLQAQKDTKFWGFNVLINEPWQRSVEATMEEKTQVSKFLEQNQTIIQEKAQSVYRYPCIYLIDVTGDGKREIILFYLKNEGPECAYENESGIGEVYDLDTCAYLGDIYCDECEGIGWWYSEKEDDKCYSLETNVSATYDENFNTIINYAYILWEVNYDGEKIDCIPQWVYAIQRTYNPNEPIEEYPYCKEERFSVDYPDKEELLAWRMNSKRPMDVLRKESTPELSNKIIKSLESLLSSQTEVTRYACVNPEGEWFSQPTFDRMYFNLTPKEVSDIMHEILKGDMSYINNWVFDWKRIYESGEYELVLCDVNRDGVEELLWCYKGEKYRIITTLTAYRNGAFECEYDDFLYSGYNYLLGKNGSITKGREYGNLEKIEEYFPVSFDENYKEKLDYSLRVIHLEGLDEGEISWGYWAVEHPYIVECKTYYEKCVPLDGGEYEYQQLTEAEFLRMYKEMTGYEYEFG